jgi:capsular exopolysaccharide synthesis family protein
MASDPASGHRERSARGTVSRLARGRVRPRAESSGAGSHRTSFEESIRILRSNLAVSLSDIDHPMVIVTSSKANEGKTVICTKLAISFAEAGQRVVLVDLDLRHSTAHRLLRTHNEFGVSDVLMGRRTLQESIQHLELQGSSGRAPSQLYFLGTGPPVHNPTELLGSGRTARLLEGLVRQADLVLLDTPPVLPVADTLEIGRIASGAILVVETRTTAHGAVQQSKDLLIRNQTRLFGVVLNKFQARDADFAYGYYGYGYGTPSSSAADEHPSDTINGNGGGAPSHTNGNGLNAPH